MRAKARCGAAVKSLNAHKHVLDRSAASHSSSYRKGSTNDLMERFSRAAEQTDASNGASTCQTGADEDEGFFFLLSHSAHCQFWFAELISSAFLLREKQLEAGRALTGGRWSCSSHRETSGTGQADGEKIRQLHALSSPRGRSSIGKMKSVGSPYPSSRRVFCGNW